MSELNIFIIMIIAGTLGGVVNYGLTRPEKMDYQGLFWSTSIGISAALLVPLFLNTISSSLLTSILDGSAKASDVYVFFGFCLLGAIASKSMIQTLTNQILRTAEEAKSKVEDLEKNVSPIIFKETELENDVEEEAQKAIEPLDESIKNSETAVLGRGFRKKIKAQGTSGEEI